MTDPRPVVALAKPGQVSGPGSRAPDALPEEYIKAAGLAFDNPGQAVVVFEYDLPEPIGVQDPSPAVVEEHAALVVKQQREVTHAVQRAQIELNRLDADGAIGNRLETDYFDRFKVGQTTHKADGVVRTWVTFHPEGRPVRKRAKK